VLSVPQKFNTLFSSISEKALIGKQKWWRVNSPSILVEGVLCWVVQEFLRPVVVFLAVLLFLLQFEPEDLPSLF
jgi:hypothetical protein